MRVLSKNAVYVVIAVLVVVSFHHRLGIQQTLLPIHDDYTYDTHAKAMLLGEPYPGRYYWPPGMSFFLHATYSLFGTDIKPLLVLISLLGSALVYLIAKELTGSEIAAATALIFSLIDPDISFYSAQLYSENIYIFLTLAVIYATLKMTKNPSIKYPLIAGLCVGLGLYQKVYTLGLVACVFIHLMLNDRWTKKGKKTIGPRALTHPLLILAVALLVASPWIIHIYQKYGVFVFMTATSGVNLYIGNNPYAHGCYTNNGFQYDERYIEKTKNLEDNTLKKYHVNKISGELTREYILEDPPRFAGKVWNQFSRFWLLPNVYCHDRAFTKNYLRYLSLLWTLTVLGILASLREIRKYAVIHLYRILICAVTLVAFYGERHRLPLVPTQFIFAGVAVHSIYSLMRRKKFMHFESIIAIIIVSVFASSYHLEKMENLSEYKNTEGLRYLIYEKPGIAEDFFKSALELDPDNAGIHHNLGFAYLKMNKTEQAEAEFKKALELDPRFQLARVALGDTYLYKGQYNKALREFETVLKTDPSLNDTIQEVITHHRDAGVKLPAPEMS